MKIVTANFFKSRWKADGLFLMGFLLMCLCYNYQNELFTRPHGHHIWRQTDGFCIVRNYADLGMDFVHPRISQFISQDGLELAEFPLSYYIAAIGYKTLGYHEWITRLVHLLFVLLGLWSLYRLCAGVLNDDFYGILLALLLFTSPTLGFYSITPLPDIPGMSLSLLGLFLFYRYLNGSGGWWLAAGCISYALAGAEKPTSCLSLIALSGVLFSLLAYHRVYKRQLVDKSEPRMAKALAVAVLALIAIGGWWKYVGHYREVYHTSYFQTYANPIWKASAEQINKVFLALDAFGFNLFLNKPALIAIGLLTIVASVILWRRHKTILFYYVVFLLGCIAYLLLFFTQLEVHDYYIIVVLPLITASLLLFVVAMLKVYPEIFRSVWLKGMMLLFVVSDLGYATYKIHQINTRPWTGNHTEVADIEPYLRSLGMKQSDYVIYWGDISPNTALYMMNQRGWAPWSLHTLEPDSVKDRMQKGAKYLIIDWNQIDAHDPEGVKASSYWASNKIGERNNVDIYQLK